MINFGRRGETPPPERARLNKAPSFAGLSRFFGIGNKADAKRATDSKKPMPSNGAIPKPSLNAKSSSTPKTLSNFVETARLTMFSGKTRSSDDYAVPRSEFAGFLSSCRQIFWAMAIFSGVSNILMLTGSFFMLQVYDRVLPSRSVPTLIALLALAILLYLFQSGLDLIRTRISARMGRHLDETLGGRVFDAVIRLPLKTRGDGDGLQPVRDLDQVRSFLASGGPSALFDIPWMPVYLGICFLFHFWIGVTALVGALVLVAITMLTEIRSQGPAKASAQFAVVRNSVATEGRRNAEALHAMGMRRLAAARWHEANRKYLAANEAASDVASGLGGASKAFRAILQSGVLAVGAYLVINQESTAGIIIAGSILTSRALAPVELAIANWKGFVSARQSRQRLEQLLTLLPKEEEPLALPSPVEAIAMENVYVNAPASDRVVLHDVSFNLRKGEGLGIIGPSGSGKSSLVRALVGVWPQMRGRITLDNAALGQWSSEALGKHIGYLPQDVELFDGSIAVNIARFDPNANPKAVLAAARAAGAHDLILSFPDGYGTKIGEGGMALSAGQRQRIGLARAFYGDPFLVVLDEPTSNLDADGEAALTEAILTVRRRNGIVVVIAHRPKALDGVDHVLVIAEGKVQSFGRKEDVLTKVLRTATPLKVVGDRG
ncbi:type I secretion system permease/ATPase [Tardiphaga sp. P9-11]|nr:type I secretion system permease/ATPase [Tardiphaga sp. P9-11]